MSIFILMNQETIWVIVGIAVVFLLVSMNNDRNQRRWRERRHRNFGEAYRKKKKEHDNSDKT